MIDPHISYSPDWATPPVWLTWVERTMGKIDFDPCPHRASYDGLQIRWRGRVYCNPPGANSHKSVKQWWAKAMAELVHVTALTWCFFNCEHARHLDPHVFDLPGWLVLPRRRIAFWREGAPVGSPRNWAWFWTTCEPADTPVPCDRVRTGK